MLQVFNVFTSVVLDHLVLIFLTIRTSVVLLLSNTYQGTSDLSEIFTINIIECNQYVP